jgi:hypothetical protein
MIYLLLTSLGSGLGDLTSLVNLLDGLDDTDSDGLTHITDSETTKRRIVSISFNTHGLGGDHLYNSRVTRLDKLGGIFELIQTKPKEKRSQKSYIIGKMQSKEQTIKKKIE